VGGKVVRISGIAHKLFNLIAGIASAGGVVCKEVMRAGRSCAPESAFRYTNYKQ
jgi:hypothetical protein